MTETIKIENTLIELRPAEDGGLWAILVAGETWQGMDRPFETLADARNWVDTWITSGQYARDMYFITGHGAVQQLRTLREALPRAEKRLAVALAEARDGIKTLADEWTDEALLNGRHVLRALDETTDAYERTVAAIAKIERRLAYAEKAAVATERPGLTLHRKIGKLSKAAKSALIEGSVTGKAGVELREAGFIGPNYGLTDSGRNARTVIITDLLDALL